MKVKKTPQESIYYNQLKILLQIQCKSPNKKKLEKINILMCQIGFQFQYFF